MAYILRTLIFLVMIGHAAFAVLVYLALTAKDVDQAPAIAEAFQTVPEALAMQFGFTGIPVAATLAYWLLLFLLTALAYRRWR